MLQYVVIVYVYRFLLLYAGCWLSMAGKGMALASPFGFDYRPFPEEHKVPVIATIIATIFLPGFLIGVFSCWHKGMLKTIVAHPSVVLMPTSIGVMKSFMMA